MKRTTTILGAMLLAGASTLGQTESSEAQLGGELAKACVAFDVDGHVDPEVLKSLTGRISKLMSGTPPAHASRPAQIRLLLDLSALLERTGGTATALSLLEDFDDSALVQRKEELRRQSEPQGASSLEAVVRECVEGKNWNRLKAIGTPVAEVMSRVVLESAGGLPEEDDALYWLLEIDERAGVSLMVEHFDAGGPLWKRRMMRALSYADCLSDQGTWTSGSPYLLLEPELLVLSAKLLGVPETATSMLKSLEGVAERDAFTPELAHAIARGLDAYGPDFSAAAMGLLNSKVPALSAQPILEAALRQEDEGLRRLAAERLVAFERSDALLSCVSSPDAFVRRCVARALQDRNVALLERGQETQHRWLPVLGARDLPLLKTLLADAEELVRVSAAFCLARLEVPLEPAEYERLSRDPSAQVRRTLVKLTQLPEGVRPGLLARLAVDPSADVIADVNFVLSQAAGINQGIRPESSPLARDPGLYLLAIEARWKSKSLPLDEPTRDWLQKALLASGEGLRALVGWSLAENSSQALQALLEARAPSAFLALTDESLARMLALPRNTSGSAERLWEAVKEAKPRRAAAMRLLLADASASRTARLAAAVLAADGSPGYGDALLGLLRQPIWKDPALDESEREQLGASGSSLPSAERCALSLAIVRDAAIEPEVAQAFIGKYPLDTPHSAELTKEVLARWFRPEVPPSMPVYRALQHLGSRADLGGIETLERALTQPAYSGTALNSMGDLRNPALLPKIARGLEAEWMPPGQDRRGVQNEAAEALAAFNDPAAAEYLLLGLKSPNEETRKICKAGLERLEEYEKHARAWKDRNLAAPTKEGALADLVTMLADKDPLLRAQAALGLATLGATETLPQLIRLLKDPDANVRAAAQKALDRLNALEPSPAPVEGG